MNVHIPNWSPELPRSGSHTLSIEGRDVPTFATSECLWSMLAGSGAMRLRLRFAGARADKPPVVRPARAGQVVGFENGDWLIDTAGPVYLCVEAAGQPVWFIYIDAPNQHEPTGDVIRFEAGKIHNVGKLVVSSNQTVWIEPGAIVYGNINATDATNVTIAGGGVLSGKLHGASGHFRRLITLQRCRDVVVAGILMIEPTGWMLVPALCDHVHIHHIKQIGEVVSSDGIDVVACSNVVIEDCMLRNNDDCVVIKSSIQRDPDTMEKLHWCRDVSDVLVQRCSFWNAKSGNAMEIGFECACDRMERITFRDIDVIGAHGFGGVFTIHNGDRALITDILYEDIRVEHFWDLFVDFRIMASRWSTDDQRGQIRNVTLRNIHTCDDIYNTPSLIGGWDARHTVEHITFDNVHVGPRHIRNADDLQLFTRHASNLHWK
jgi:hypothetical protein